MPLAVYLVGAVAILDDGGYLLAGVSGVASHEDVQIAQAGIEALG